MMLTLRLCIGDRYDFTTSEECTNLLRSKDDYEWVCEIEMVSDKPSFCYCHAYYDCTSDSIKNNPNNYYKLFYSSYLLKRITDDYLSKGVDQSISDNCESFLNQVPAHRISRFSNFWSCMSVKNTGAVRNTNVEFYCDCRIKRLCLKSEFMGIGSTEGFDFEDDDYAYPRQA